MKLDKILRCLSYFPYTPLVGTIFHVQFFSAHLSSLSRCFWITAQHSRVSAIPPSFVLSVNLVRKHSGPSSKSFMNKLNNTGHSRPLGDTTSYRSATMLCDTDHNPLSHAIQLVLSPHNHSLIQPAQPKRMLLEPVLRHMEDRDWVSQSTWLL